MSIFHAVTHRLKALLRREDFERDLEEEMHFHLSLEAMEQRRASGGTLAPADASFAARRKFGNSTLVNEERRAMAGLGFMELVRQDARFALRSFRRTPGFTAVAMLTLAVGIGANTAIFSAVHAMLLRPLPFHQPERLMRVSLTSPASPDRSADDDQPWSYPKFVVLRDQQQVFSQVALHTDRQVSVGGRGDVERVRGELAGTGYLSLLGVQPVLGRTFLPEEDAQPNGPRAVILGDAFWKRRYNADPAVLGQSLRINGELYTIVGVLPTGFGGMSGNAEVWTTLMSLEQGEREQPWNLTFEGVGRLASGVSPEQARTTVAQLGERIEAAHPNPFPTGASWGAAAETLDAVRVTPLLRRSLLVLLGAVTLVMLITCANVANLFLVRAAGRRREIAVRLAVGGARRRIIRQLVTESLLLAMAGGALGVLLAWWGTKLLATMDPAAVLRMQSRGGLGAVNFSGIHLDLPALAFAGSLVLVTGVMFGLVPALRATPLSLTEDLKNGRQREHGRGLRHVSSRSLLATAEVSLALVLLAGAGLMLRSLSKLVNVPPGVEAEHVLTLRLNTPADYGRDSLPRFYDRMVEQLAALPGVAHVALADCPPLNGGCNGTVISLRDKPPVAEGAAPETGVHWISPAWNSVMKVPLLRGRLLNDGDRAGTQKVVLVSESAARTFWPGQDPIGRPVSVGQGGFWNDTARVVGVVGNVRYESLEDPVKPDVYLSYYQSPRASMMLLLRTAGDPLLLTESVRRVLRDAAPESPLYDVRTLEARMGDASAGARASTSLLMLFALVALSLAAIGTYGVISFSVSQRRREFGIRLALGATRGDVVRLVLGQGLAIALVGGATGLVIALGTTRVLTALLYDVQPSDPATLVAIAVLLTAAVLLASWLPARRAARTRPGDLLRLD
ncbi:MAG: ABC transporter permease [Gemmatimonadaceae bacterium]